MTEGFPCTKTFYSNSRKLDQILLKNAFYTKNKYILKLIIKKLASFYLNKCGNLSSSIPVKYLVV